MLTCGRCGAMNAVAARFCSACGSLLADGLRDGLEVRKTVTILFSDVVDSTSLGEATDAETMRRVMARWAEAMTEVIEQHGGTVERFRGDEVMAVFGVPTAHEDDAMRAARAAIDMQKRLRELNVELHDGFGVELACRIGVNTGEVLAGDPGTGQTFVTGDAVNLAKRLQQAAEPGSILIGTATYPLVKDAVRVGPRERFTAKGKSEPVTRITLEGVDATAPGYARRLDAPLVGRSAELAWLEARVGEAFQTARCTVATVLGHAGIGKSRLVGELVARSSQNAHVLTGRCPSYGSGITYWPLAEVVAGLGGLAAVRAAFNGTEGAEEVVERLGMAIGELDGQVSTDELFWAVRQLFERLASVRPLLVVLDDLHWAEPTMLDLVEYLSTFVSGPLLLLCVARTELLDVRPAFGRGAALELSPLTEAETSTLLQALGLDDASLRERVTSTAEGNPLFAEQLAAMITDADQPLDPNTQLPASIQALLAARLDSLAREERQALERAAVVGRSFSQRAVVDLSGADQARVPGRLLSLVNKGLLSAARSGDGSNDEFRFRHTLIREIAYASMPRRVRAELHEQYADSLERRPSGRLDTAPERIGYHYEQAYDFRQAEHATPDDRSIALRRKAAQLLGAAGSRAFARDDMRAATNLIQRAVALMAEDDPNWGKLNFELSGALWSTGDRARADEALESVLATALASDDAGLEWHARLERAGRRGLSHDDDLDQYLSGAERAREVFESAGDGLGLARAWRRIGLVHRLRGQFGLAVEAEELALEHAVRIGDGREEGRIVDSLCSALLYGPVPATDAIRRCDALADGARGRPSVEAAVLSSLAGLVAMEGRFD